MRDVDRITLKIINITGKEHHRCDKCQENEAEDRGCVHRKGMTQLNL